MRATCGGSKWMWCLQDGKDYIPLTAGEEAEGPPVTPDPRSLYNGAQSGEVLEAQLHYDSPPALGSAVVVISPFPLYVSKSKRVCSAPHCPPSPVLRSSQQGERCGRPLSVKTFEDIPVAHSSVMVRAGLVSQL